MVRPTASKECVALHVARRYKAVVGGRFLLLIMRRRLTTLLFVSLASVSIAEPIPIPQESYIDSEKLTITVNPGYALFDGSFVYKATEQVGDAPAAIAVPIWIPDSAADSQSSLARFLRSFTPGTGARMDETRTTLVNNFLKLSVVFVGMEVAPTRFTSRVFKEDDKAPPDPSLRPGALSLLFHSTFNRDWLKQGVRVTLTYHQPLLTEGEDKVLFYVPILKNIPAGAMEKNPEKYLIKIKAASGLKLEPVSELKYQSPASPTELNILPEDGKPIVVKVKGA